MIGDTYPIENEIVVRLESIRYPDGASPLPIIPTKRCEPCYTLPLILDRAIPLVDKS